MRRTLVLLNHFAAIGVLSMNIGDKNAAEGLMHRITAVQECDATGDAMKYCSRFPKK
ncbi:MAG TPA: hypothetical protein PL045_01105 [Chitinophagaceae bacterium]|nr:hypothetical protein [Chitinophagaceae bacterium]